MTTPMTGADVAVRAQELLGELAGPAARLRPDQATAIAALVRERRRLLVVQRTGWGKSAVYFIATRLLRAAGAGPTLLVSPLLALMRDQIAAAERIGVRAATINSTNVDQWREVEQQLVAGDVDLLLISPERLNHPRFRREVLPQVAARIGLLVIDEAHCISDWGHDFRPDYRRIRTVLDDLPAGVPVLATTATANLRVTRDVAEQLGEPLTLRGSLDRESLALAVVDLPTAAERLAFLADWIPMVEGSGIVYCLTVAEAERVAAFLAGQGIAAAAYTGQTDPAVREQVEADLKADRLKAVVATSALGMGYDKPDLRFVVHLGSPSSPVAYYQAVGRAGRAVPRAEVVLLPAASDEDVWAYFDATAMPAAEVVEEVLAAVPPGQGAVSTAALEQRVNLPRGRLEAVLKVLDVEGAVDRVEGGWRGTGLAWRPDAERLDRVRAARKAEQQAMRDYLALTTCRMAFLRRQLDDEAVADCGRCDRCDTRWRLPAPSPTTTAAALAHLRGAEVVVPARKRWPSGLADRRGTIGAAVRAEEGRALAFARDPGWEEVVTALLGPAGTHRWEAALEEAVAGLTRVLARWDWPARPSWVTWIPSRARPALPPALAQRLGALGRLPVLEAVRRRADTPPQSRMGNSAHAAANALAGLALQLPPDAPPGPVLLVDDFARTGWTLTAVAVQLREAGASAVLPVVLQQRA